MDSKEVLNKIQEVRELSKKRNFKQTFDLTINLKNLDLRKPESKVDFGVKLDCQLKTKKLKVLAVIDHSISGAEEVFDKVLYNDELASLKSDMQAIRKITHGFDKFVVQMNHMPLFAQVLGKFLGPMGKMPSPKLGMIINPKSDLAKLYENLQQTAHVQLKKNLVLQVSIGSENESDEIIMKNIVHIYESLVHALPDHNNNLKNISLKLTMSKPVVL